MERAYCQSCRREMVTESGHVCEKCAKGQVGVTRKTGCRMTFSRKSVVCGSVCGLVAGLLVAWLLTGCTTGQLEREIDRINEKIPTCTANLLAVADWEIVAECGGDGCVLIPDFAHFYLGGVKVFAAPDLVYIAEGRLHVIDWKSGKPGDDDHVQVLLSAYCVSLENPGVESNPVLHYLLSGKSLKPDVPDDLETFVADTVGPGLRAMRDLLHDPQENAPLAESEFPRRESGLCSYCNFARLCEAD